ncbi:MAG: RBBP9/YdeN family alpha/beta hydrolase [Hyphomicrobiaceae bacterium]
MRIADVDILIVPGWGRNSDDHWQSRWARNMRTAKTVVQDDWDRPVRDAWVARLMAAVNGGTRPAVLVAHSCGVMAVVHAAPQLVGSRVAGAFLVAPPDLEDRAPIETFMREAGSELVFPETFLPAPMQPLPFPVKLIGSSTDPYCSVERVQALGAAWGADVSIIANGGHINTASGHGPWPEGLLTFGTFLKKLGPAA